MSKFPIKETVVSVRGASIRVRELTQGERTQVFKAGKEDGLRLPALVMSMGAIDPRWTEQEVADESAEIVEAVVREVMALSGMAEPEGDVKND